MDTRVSLERLDVDNYSTWAVRMRFTLISKGLWKHVINNGEVTDTDGDQKALALIGLLPSAAALLSSPLLPPLSLSTATRTCFTRASHVLHTRLCNTSLIMRLSNYWKFGGGRARTSERSTRASPAAAPPVPPPGFRSTVRGFFPSMR